MHLLRCGRGRERRGEGLDGKLGRFEGRRLKGDRERRGLSQAELGRRAGLPQTTISNYENRPNTRPPADALVALGAALGVDWRTWFVEEAASRAEGGTAPAPSLEELVRQLQERVKEVRQPVRIPVLNVSAHAHYEPGVPIDLERFGVVRYISGGEEFEGRDVWAVPVRGECLMPRVEDGDIAVFERGARPRPYDYVVAIHMGTLLVKRATVAEGRVLLLHDNETDQEGKPIRVNGHTHVLGPVVEFRRPM